MPVELTQDVVELLKDRNYAVAATLNRDGSPQLTIVWVDTDGQRLIVNTAEGRQKPRNLRRDPRISVLVFNRHNFYDWVRIDGRVMEITPEQAEEHIHQLAKLYWDKDRYPMQPGMVRLKVVVEPERVFRSKTPSPTLM